MFLNSEYVSDFESEVQSEAGSLSSSRVEDEFEPIPTGSKRSFDGRDKPTRLRVLDQQKQSGAQAVLENAYQRHNKMVNDYLMYYGGSRKDFERDTSKDKRDIDVIKAHNRFMWSEEDAPYTWEERLAKRYWDRLFKEYCMADLSRYREDKLGLRWRSKREVASGKGQFVCGALSCDESTNLRSWEVNFAYVEQGSKQNALVKLRLCPRCSDKLNFHKQHAEHIQPVKKNLPDAAEKDASTSKEPEKEVVADSSAWKSSEGQASEETVITGEDAFDDYFKDMFL